MASAAAGAREKTVRRKNIFSFLLNSHRNVVSSRRERRLLDVLRPPSPGLPPSRCALWRDKMARQRGKVGKRPGKSPSHPSCPRRVRARRASAGCDEPRKRTFFDPENRRLSHPIAGYRTLSHFKKTGVGRGGGQAGKVAKARPPDQSLRESACIGAAPGFKLPPVHGNAI